jgi:hypothetical protein
MKEIAVSSELIAAIVGSISSRSAVNMRLVSVWYSPPEMNSDTTVSSMAEMKANSMPEMTLGPDLRQGDHEEGAQPVHAEAARHHFLRRSNFRRPTRTEVTT